MKAFIPSANVRVPPGDYQPDSYVYIDGQQYRLANIPTTGSQILVDITRVKGGRAVAVGDSVCLLCADHPVGDLAEVSGRAGG